MSFWTHLKEAFRIYDYDPGVQVSPDAPYPNDGSFRAFIYQFQTDSNGLSVAVTLRAVFPPGSEILADQGEGSWEYVLDQDFEPDPDVNLNWLIFKATPEEARGTYTELERKLVERIIRLNEDLRNRYSAIKPFWICVAFREDAVVFIDTERSVDETYLLIPSTGDVSLVKSVRPSDYPK